MAHTVPQILALYINTCLLYKYTLKSKSVSNAAIKCPHITPQQEAKPDAKLTCNLVRMRNKRPLAYQHQHPSFWRQLEILRKLKIGSSMGNFL